MKKILWIDLEMTGLDVTKESIIEVAYVVTDLKFKELDFYQAVVRQPSDLLEKMDDWNKTHHKNSGLLDLIPLGKSITEVEEELLEKLDKQFPKEERIVIAGNSIYQDRAFIRKEFPCLEKRLHYRMLDVTSWKAIFKSIYNKEYKKKNAHRALEDIRESVKELQYYISFINIDSDLV